MSFFNVNPSGERDWIDGAEIEIIYYLFGVRLSLMSFIFRDYSRVRRNNSRKKLLSRVLYRFRFSEYAFLLAFTIMLFSIP